MSTPEPDNGSYVLIERDADWQVLRRHDLNPVRYNPVGEPVRWFASADPETVPQSWMEAVGDGRILYIGRVEQS